jgi:polyferredoxin
VTRREREDEVPAGGARRRSAGGWKTARWIRRTVQVLCLAIFVYLLFGALQRLEPRPYANVFFRFDPLAGLATMLAVRAWLAPFALALITLALSVVFGRYWCGWVCPTGTLLGWFSAPSS